MRILGLVLRISMYGLGYGLFAGVAIAFARFDGGLATFWIATAYLTALLTSRPRREWLAIVCACGGANTLLTGLVGLGWVVSFPLAAVNMLEAVVGAILIRRTVAPAMMDSLQWFARYILKIGLLAPAVGALAGSITLSVLLDHSVGASAVTWFIGHGLGGITFTPFFILLFRGYISRFIRGLDSRGATETALLLSFLMATVFATFAQSRWPLLFFPLGPLSLICFRQDRVVASTSIVLLAITGAYYTAIDSGPISLMPVGPTERTQFFQFYLASIVMTVLPIIADLRARRRLHREVRTSQRQLQLLMENSTDAIFHLQPDGSIIFASPSVSALSGQDADALKGRNALDLVHDNWRDFVRDCHQDVLLSDGRSVRYEYLANTSQGPRWFETVSQTISSPSGRIESVISVVRDVDDRKRSELELVKEARVDALTGLLNRYGLSRQFEDIVRSGNHCIAAMDIDHFKAINDSYGHAAGDRALQTFADVAKSVVRKCDIVARTGGEEFVILFRDTPYEAALEACERLRLAVAQTSTLYGSHRIRFTVSIGLGEVLSPDLDAEIGRADVALYAAKRDGRDCLRRAA